MTNLVMELENKFMFFKNRKSNKQQSKSTTPLPGYQEYLSRKIDIDENHKLPKDSETLHRFITKIFQDSDDFQVRDMKLPSKQQVYIYYINRLIDDSLLHDWIIHPLNKRIKENNLTYVKESQEAVQANQIHEITNWKQLIQRCLTGHVIFHVDGLEAVSVKLASFEKRNTSDPTTEHQVYGPKMGFIEDSRTNVSIMRKFIADPRLKMKEFHVGTLSHTHVALLYLEEYVDPDLVQLVSERIYKVADDNVVSSGQLEKYLFDHPMSVFPQSMKTERPDNASYSLSQGKVIVIVDNSTFGIILPIAHFDLFLTSEDNFLQVWHKTLLRIVRMTSLIIATIFPALYVSLIAFHPELIPSTLALTIAEARNNIPFTASAEAFMMVFALDVLVESSMRLPQVVGQTVGIVGGLVIGQAAVEAGVVSSTMIIVVASTAIASFTTPSWDLVSSVRVCRYLLLILASSLGLYGLSIGLFLIFIHLCHLTSLSKPYLSPLTPLNPKELFQIFIQKPPRNNG